MVSFESKNKVGICEGFLQGNLSEARYGIVVLHEWWGLTNHIRDISAEIVLEGNCITLAPDLYRGEVTADMMEAARLMTSLDWHGAVEDASAAARYLLSKGCSKVGVTGFSMGGALSLATAALSSDVTAAATFYGIPVHSMADLSAIKIPVQCHFGETDDIYGFSSLKDVEILRELFKSSKVDHELFLYPTGHAFINPGSPAYDEEICRLAINRLVRFMKNQLKA